MTSSLLEVAILSLLLGRSSRGLRLVLRAIGRDGAIVSKDRTQIAASFQKAAARVEAGQGSREP